MSGAAASCEGGERMMFCASCGVVEGDDIKLKRCTACHLVKYCGVKCQKDHRPTHKRECKKRAAELRDEILFKQPESSHLGDCPICCLPLPIDRSESTLMNCCSKCVCDGCNIANQKREFEEGKLQAKCPFCRKAAPNTNEEIIVQRMKRIEANDPVAMCEMGTERCGKGDYTTAFGYYSRAAALGVVQAHYHLSILYHEGKGVEKDEKMEQHHKEQAAIGGHPEARYNLGCVENKNGTLDRAVKHFIIAAKLGFDISLEAVKNAYKAGLVSKEDFAAALCGYQAAIEATKSPQREEATAFKKRMAERAERRWGIE